MKKFLCGLLAVTALVLTGCLVTSVYPFYHAKDVVFDPGLIGEWATVKEEGESSEFWHFEREGTNAYMLTYKTGDESSVMLTHAFKLNGHLFLDTFTTDISDKPQPPPIPSHFLFRVFQTTPTIRMAPMDYEWLGEFLEKNPKAIRHHVISYGEKENDSRIILTADTAELQKFVIKHLKTEDAWKEAFELKRETAKPSAKESSESK